MSISNCEVVIVQEDVIAKGVAATARVSIISERLYLKVD